MVVLFEEAMSRFVVKCIRKGEVIESKIIERNNLN